MAQPINTLLELIIGETLVEAISDYLCIENLGNWTIHYDANTQKHRLRGYFENKATAIDEFKTIHLAFPELSNNYQLLPVIEEDWQNAYKAFLQPWSYKELHWIPEWMRTDIDKPATDAIVYLDAGMAFGTGAHETTRLIAKRLIDFKEQRPNGLSTGKIIDAGCGSGILAISAHKIGFKIIRAFDLDPEAIRVSLENLQRNELSNNAIQFTCSGIVDGLNEQSADFIMANILASVLCEYRKELLNAITPGGSLALSGILQTELEEVRQQFVRQAIKQWGHCRSNSRMDGEWGDLLLQRPFEC